MRNLIKAGFIWAGILLSSLSAFSQSVPLSALPMQFNGSFAGETGAPRLSLNNGYFWTHYPKNMIGLKQSMFVSAVSYDQFIPGLRTGIGLIAGIGSYKAVDTLNDYKAEGTLRSVGLDIAPKFSIKGKYTLSPSASVSYGRRALDIEGQENRTIERLGARIGLLWNTPKYYIGYSYEFNDLGRLSAYPKGYYPHRSTLQLGYTFQKSAESDFSFTPQFVILVTTPNRLDEGTIFDRYLAAYILNFRYKKFIWGVNNDGLHVGLQSERLRLMLTADPAYFNINSRRHNRYEYSGNLSFRYVFK